MIFIKLFARKFQQQSMLISLFYYKNIFSPRSLKAIDNLGYKQQEFLIKQINEFEEEAINFKAQQHLDPDIYIKERYQQYEMKRQEKIRLVSQERNKIIKQEEKENEYRSRYSQTFHINSGSKTHNISLTQESFLERGSKELWHIKSKNQKDIEFLYDKQMLWEELEQKNLLAEQRLQEIQLNQQIKQNQKQVIEQERQKSIHQKKDTDQQIRLAVAKQIIAQQEKDDARVKSLSSEKLKQINEIKQTNEIKRQQTYVNKLENQYNNQRCKTENYNRKSKQEFKQVMEKRKQIEFERQQKIMQAEEERQKIEEKIQQLKAEKQIYLMMLDEQIGEKDKTSSKRKKQIDNQRYNYLQERRANSELRQASIYQSINTRHELMKKKRQSELASKSREADKRLEKIEMEEEERVRQMQEELEKRQESAQQKTQQLQHLKQQKRKQEHQNMLLKEQYAEQVRQQKIQQDLMKLQIKSQIKQESARENIDRIQTLKTKKLQNIRQKISMDDEKYNQLLLEKEELQRIKENIQRSLDKQKQSANYQYKKALRAFRRKDTLGLEKSLQENSVCNITSYEGFDEDSNFYDNQTTKNANFSQESSGFSKAKQNRSIYNSNDTQSIQNNQLPISTTNKKNKTIGFCQTQYNSPKSNQIQKSQNKQVYDFYNEDSCKTQNKTIQVNSCQNQNQSPSQTLDSKQEQSKNKNQLFINRQSQNQSPIPDKYRLNPLSNESLTVQTRFNKIYKSNQNSPRKNDEQIDLINKQAPYFQRKNKRLQNQKQGSPDSFQQNIFSNTPKVSVLQQKRAEGDISTHSKIIKLDKLKQFEGYLNQSNQNFQPLKNTEEKNHKSIKTETTIEVSENDYSQAQIQGRNTGSNTKRASNRYKENDDKQSKRSGERCNQEKYESIVISNYTINKQQNFQDNSNKIDKSKSSIDTDKQFNQTQYKQNTQVDQQNRNLLNPERVDDEPTVKQSIQYDIYNGNGKQKIDPKKNKNLKDEKTDMQFQETQFSQNFGNIKSNSNYSRRESQQYNIKQSQNSLNLMQENNIPQYVILADQNSPDKQEPSQKVQSNVNERQQNSEPKKDKIQNNESQNKH
ncbi:endo-1,4-beta-xylanase xylA, putative (macronuclear) [Tetrahymena thermophila SB210]|uniref:Endo-1,4-beta-xylanase xylA, putative n=1 Tax=Tetrahymena thermophila (strain SB210) TaxID=312017 RepID=Q23KH0_TETTS|nr:endo-1,4-beta-xylanase xylA, putative [Tetrahymena thermophila SB210]EAR96873.2 endo-1,4-beta-xylanase xylA, putative [Tetrahymena thermophila SB210]|eukprot:XP_001017118.2 endo-1,4-beta-xylanase xylA, putative [Tetrahymena thermophila SB210]